MKSFDSWYTELISNEIWSAPARMHHKEETFRRVANVVYMEYVAAEVFPPIQVARVYVFNKLGKILPDKQKVNWVEKSLEKLKEEKKEWEPVSWEKRAEYLRQVQAEIDRIDDNKIRPLFEGEAETNGQYDLPKPKAKCAPSAPVEVIISHIDKVHAARRKYFLEKNPNATEEQIEDYLNKFPEL